MLTIGYQIVLMSRYMTIGYQIALMPRYKNGESVEHICIYGLVPELSFECVLEHGMSANATDGPVPCHFLDYSP